MSDLLQFTPGARVPDGTITELLMAHDSYVRARELREHATVLLALLGMPLALAVGTPGRWPQSLIGPVLVGFGAALVLTIGAAIAEWARHRRRAQLVARVEPPRPPSP